MRAPFTQLYLHLVWGTWNRLPLITTGAEAGLYRTIHEVCQELRCHLLAIGGVADHIHLLLRIPTTLSVAEIVKQIKGVSSRRMSSEILREDFKWQGGYGAFTLRLNETPSVTRYILDQKQHHQTNDLWKDWEQTELIEPDQSGPGG